ncbi:6737_t:CDS:1 [Paraglomus occultum]|uniref:6737_t:CDS:1 n=1 Tax=Paraglomus occultum TaxID=144539 RepID=A0A9N8WBA2_9GLOM|nr:6737_t:CDS:1 [Paraglomus occultum]
MSTKDCIAFFAALLVIVGGILLGISKSLYTKCVENCDMDLLTSFENSPPYDDYSNCINKCKNKLVVTISVGIGLVVIGPILLFVACTSYNQGWKSRTDTALPVINPQPIIEPQRPPAVIISIEKKYRYVFTQN